MKSILFILLVLPCALISQTWVVKYDDVYGSPVHLTHKADSIIVITSTNGFFIKTIVNSDGELLQTYPIQLSPQLDVQDYNQAGVLGLSNIVSEIDSVGGLKLMEMTDDGIVLWEKSFFYSDSTSILDGIFQVLDDNKILVAGRTETHVPINAGGDLFAKHTLVLFLLDEFGNIEWRSDTFASSPGYYGSHPFQQILQDPKGNFHVFGHVYSQWGSPPSTFVHHIKVNETGELIKRYTYQGTTSGQPSHFGRILGDALFDGKNNLFLIGSKFNYGTSSGNRYFNLEKLKLIDSINYESTYTQTFGVADLGGSPSAFGIHLEHGCNQNLLSLEEHEHYFKMIVQRDTIGDILTSTLLPTYLNPFSTPSVMMQFEDGAVLATNSGNGKLKMFRTDCSGFFSTSNVTGKLFLDENQNCLLDVGEDIIPNTSFSFDNNDLGFNPKLRHRLKTNEHGEFLFSPEIGEHIIASNISISGTPSWPYYEQIPQCENLYSFNFENLGDSLTINIPFVTELISSNENLEEVGFKVFPNPVTDQFITIEVGNDFANSIGKVLLKNVHGQVLKQVEFHNHQQLEIDIPAGMYFICLELENRVMVQKVLKL